MAGPSPLWYVCGPMAFPRVAIVGAPNVGKSTLFNRLLGRRRSLVADLPGLTRDCIEARADLGGRSVTLVDTGGLMPPSSTPLAGEIRRRVALAARDSTLILLLVDARRGLVPLDEDLARLFRESGRPAILVVNKVDDVDDGVASAEFSRLGFGMEETFSISAEHGLRLSDLVAAILERLPEREPDGLSEPEIRVAILGRPNVGKSSILNALLKEDRAIVSEEPGTTRDPVDATVDRQGKRYRLIDTAGMRKPGRVKRGAEHLSVGAARRSVRGADVTLVLIDATEGLVAQDLHVLGLVAGGEGEWLRPAVILLNKIDLLAGRDAVVRRVSEVRERVKFARFAPIVPVSAVKRLHLDRVFAAIDAVREESSRLLRTGDLNDWLRETTAKHAVPMEGGRRVSLVFVSQTASRPATFTILTNRAGRPHFSYTRYIENSLRERFGLRLTPILIRFRARKRTPPRPAEPRRAGSQGKAARGARRGEIDSPRGRE